jgi:hypothetical protein
MATLEQCVDAGVALLAPIKRVCAVFPDPDSGEILLLYTAAVENDCLPDRQRGENGQPLPDFIGAYGVCQQELPSIAAGLKGEEQFLACLTPEERAAWTSATPESMALMLSDPKNNVFSILGCRFHYWNSPGPLPVPTDFEGMWDYYHIYYNSINGATTFTEWQNSIARLVLPILARVAFSQIS